MNIQIGSPQNSPFQSGMSSNPFMQQMQMFQMLVQMMMSLMQMFGGGGAPGGDMGMAPNNPSFGSGCGCDGGMPTGGGMPGGNYGGGNNHYGGGGNGVPGFSDFGGNNSGTGTVSGNDSYVPPGNNQAGQIGDLGQGSGADAVRWAMQHEGVSESNNPGMVRQFSRGAWQPWCADFVSQAYANTPGGSPFGHRSSVASILQWGRENERFFSAGAAQREPGSLRPGDLAIWRDQGRSHVGLVTGINEDGTFNTIEGNTSDAVRRRTHSFGRGLTGFVRPRG